MTAFSCSSHRPTTKSVLLTETVGEDGNEFGFNRLMKYFRENHNKDLKTIHQDIIVDLDTFKGRNSYRDDITMLTCRVE